MNMDSKQRLQHLAGIINEDQREHRSPGFDENHLRRLLKQIGELIRTSKPEHLRDDLQSLYDYQKALLGEG